MSRRFKSLANLYGKSSIEKFTCFHVAVLGLGGIGSWIVEALVRSAIGFITLVDLDNVSLSNTNRQIHAIQGEYGKAKTQAMKERIILINPDVQVRVIEEFVTEENIDSLLFKDEEGSELRYNMIIDAIDNAKVKAAIISACSQRNQPVLTIGGAGGKIDPMSISCADLSMVENDRLLSSVRTSLRRFYGFPSGALLKGKDRIFDVPAIYSSEKIFHYTDRVPLNGGLSCAGLGSSVCVTASMGFAAAAYTINLLSGHHKAS